jgi:hypothetical protein
LIGTYQRIDSDWLTQRWARLLDKYGPGYKPRDCYCKPCLDQLGYLSYMFGLNRNYPRGRPPWEGLKGHIFGHNLPKPPSAPPPASTRGLSKASTTIDDQILIRGPTKPSLPSGSDVPSLSDLDRSSAMAVNAMTHAGGHVDQDHRRVARDPDVERSRGPPQA